MWFSPQPELSRHTPPFCVCTADKQRHLKRAPFMRTDMAMVYFLHFVYLFVYLLHKKKTARSAKEKAFVTDFAEWREKRKWRWLSCFLVRANHELNIAPPSTRNRTENLKEGELDLRRAYGAESHLSPCPHQVFFTRINNPTPPIFSVLSFAPAGWRSLLR